MLLSVPWWLWFFMGFFIGGLAFSKKLRQTADGIVARIMGKKKKRKHHYDDDGGDDDDNDDGRRKRGDTVVYRKGRGTTIREIHFHDD